MSSRIIPLFAFIFAVIIFFVYVNPTWSVGIADTKTAIADDNQALDSAAKYKTRQNQIAAARDAIDSAKLAALTTFLPGSVENVGLILDLNALASRSGLSITNIDVITDASAQQGSNSTNLSDVNPVGSVDMSLSASGTFAALQTFLNGVEMSARLLDVHDLVVKGSDTGVYTYQMIIRLYWLR
jgi:Tfp pilus assembly protein PilO